MSSEFFNICEDYGVPNNPMKYRDKTFYWTYQHGVGWPNDYLGPDSMTQWIIEKSDGFTDVGLYRISESVRAYAYLIYLILSSQASARSSIMENTGSALTAQSALLNNFENVVNHRVNIQVDIKHYQDTLCYASSKVDYSMGKNTYMLPSDMNLKIRLGTVRYNNKILVSDGKFSLRKNEKVNSLVLGPWTPLAKPCSVVHGEPLISTPKMKSHKYSKTNSLGLAHSPNISHKNQEPTLWTDRQGFASRTPPGSHNEEKIALVLALASGLQYGIYFDESQLSLQ